ncbi:MAG TPA: TadE/TadG family type IV pilus assembly protein [Pirellulaceae bacterium]|nr:TadE/TadG family type IV pilus assembly protein [Pirellulaceae bacterium]HMO92424.1 TadE/TadG family type IV pilus assembly protein [Pirellulaceae bacterium]HMP69543.1 TadE/TadG family type IV pilus assembly protein [Pirellulaceae bacterium]
MISLPANRKNLSSRFARTKRKDRLGATAIEFAIVFPILMLFFIAAMAFTQAFMLRDTAQHAAYKGARRGLVWNSTTNDVKSEVEIFLSRLGIRGAIVTTEPAEIDNQTQTIAVHVAIPMNRNAWVASPMLPKGFQPGSTVTLNRPTLRR